uniref:Uncharacterized protein n=1 Tax=Salix viminalis TaxID=40686 RepID=A0A6N2MNS3_SALVM
MECGWCFGPVAAAAKRREEQRGGEVGGEFRMVELPCGCCGSCYNGSMAATLCVFFNHLLCLQAKVQAYLSDTVIVLLCSEDRVSCFGSWRGLTWTSLAFQDCPLKSSSCKDGYK